MVNPGNSMRPGSAHVSALLVIVGLLLLGTAVVYVTGGTSYAFPYVLLIPVLVAAARYRLAGGIVAALAAGLLLGPLMPLDVARGADQTALNWITRVVFFVLLGGVSGWLFAVVGRQSAERERLVREDRPTGLPNRAALEERLEAALRAATLEDGAAPVLYIVRITDFFEALDAVGADAADELAGNTARLIEQAEVDLGRAYRLGAAEIAFVAEREPPERIEAEAAQLKAVGEQPVRVHGVPIRVELCIGAERAGPDDAERPHELIRRTYLALRTAQERNQDYAIYDAAFERPSAETFRLITRMRQALREHQFELFYQPKIRLEDGAVVGVEALIRWHDPEHGIVPPAQFISKVERTSLIRPLTRFALEQACGFARAHPDLTVSVNLSPRNLYDEQLLDKLCALIDQYGIPVARIELEITEGTVAHNPVRAAEYLARLRAHGIPVSIDDFGTGYSSFAYLHRLPVTGLKIDRSFIAEIESDPRVRGVLHCIAEAGHTLGLQVIAEGVETGPQLATVRWVGCDLAQGYYFTHPLPARELEQWISTYQATGSSQRTGGST